ncbi:CapA family protein [Ahrensia marina]|uniref:CapA family protein n=1 Tax=Ahrensia marina TaxID=1514904 RepID=UPI0035D06B3A
MSGWNWTRAPQAGEITLGLVGDTNIQGRGDPASAFMEVMDTLHDLDLLMGQLECPLSKPSDDPLAPDISYKKGWKHSDPLVAEGFKKAGFKAVSFASNVTFPPAVAVETAAHLDRAGIAHAGGGKDWAAARAPAIVESGGVTVALLSYTSVFWPIEQPATAKTPGVATIKGHTAYQPGRRVLEMPGAPPDIHTWADPDELAAMVDDVKAAKAKADIVIVACHWGVSSQEEHVGYQTEIGKAAIDAGADLVYGTHSHMIGGVELYKGRPIFYSLGNFAFDWQKMRGRNLDGLMVRCVVGRQGIAHVGLVPVRRNDDNNIAVLDPHTPEGALVVNRLSELSEGLGARFVLRGNEVMVEADSQVVSVA